MHKTIETERLRIRPLCTGDKDFILNLLNTEGWLRHIGDRNVNNIDEARDYIMRILNNRNYNYNVFETKDSKKPLGLVTLLKRDHHEFPDIGFAILPEFSKQGYAFEAASAYLQTILAESPDTTVIGITVPGNSHSIKLLERLGMVFSHTIEEEKQALSIYFINNKT